MTTAPNTTEHIVSPRVKLLLPKVTQEAIWEALRYIEVLQRPIAAPVQVFHLSPDTDHLRDYQKINAENEQIWKGGWLVGTKTTVTATIYTVNNGRYTRMLLDEEVNLSRDPYFEYNPPLSVTNQQKGELSTLFQANGGILK